MYNSRFQFQLSLLQVNYELQKALSVHENANFLLLL